MSKRRRPEKAPAPEPMDEEESSEEEEQQEGSCSEIGTSSDSAVTDGSEGPGSGDDGQATSMEEEVEVDIEFFDPKEGDFHGIKTLLQDLLGGVEFDASGLADAIIAQSSVGTVVKSGEDEEPIGVVSPLNLRRYAQLGGLQAVKAHLVRSCGDARAKEALPVVLEDAGTGLVLNERLVNAPPQIAPPLMQALFDEIGWAVEDQPTKELQDSFRFTQFLLIAPAYRDPQAGAAEPEAKPAKPPRPSKKKAKAEEMLMYTKPEDEFFHKHCSWSYTFSTPKEGAASAEEELQPIRLVMLVTTDQVAAARKELDEVVGNAAAAEDAEEQLPALTLRQAHLRQFGNCVEQFPGAVA